MPEKKRVVHYLNQFFAQIGGEDKADVGFSIEEKPIGPGLAIQNALGDEYEIVATVICGDNHFSDDVEKATSKAVELIKEQKPDLVLAGPAFTAGRYGVACGSVCKAVTNQLWIPAVTAMNEESPGVAMFAKDIYIVKAPKSAKGMVPTVQKMAALIKQLVAGTPNPRLFGNDSVPSPHEYDYFLRGAIRNEKTEQTGAQRWVDALLAKIKGEPFKTDIEMHEFTKVEPAPPIEDISKAKIAFATDTGVCHPDNPDHLTSGACTPWGEYDIDVIFPGGEQVHGMVHGGCDNLAILRDYNRSMPVDAARKAEEDGAIGGLERSLFSTCGNIGVAARNMEMGEEIAQRLLELEVDGVILTSA